MRWRDAAENRPGLRKLRPRSEEVVDIATIEMGALVLMHEVTAKRAKTAKLSSTLIPLKVAARGSEQQSGSPTRAPSGQQARGQQPGAGAGWAAERAVSAAHQVELVPVPLDVAQHRLPVLPDQHRRVVQLALLDIRRWGASGVIVGRAGIGGEGGSAADGGAQQGAAGPHARGSARWGCGERRGSPSAVCSTALRHFD